MTPFKKAGAALLAMVLLTAGLVLSAAAPAQAWSYCSHTDRAGWITFYDNQGYCGQKVEFQVPPDSVCSFGEGRCAGWWNNWAGSVVNKQTNSVFMFDNWLGGCSGSGAVIAAGTSHPNLYAINSNDLGNKVSCLEG